jgi:hypothetical protein
MTCTQLITSVVPWSKAKSDALPKGGIVLEGGPNTAVTTSHLEEAPCCSANSHMAHSNVHHSGPANRVHHSRLLGLDEESIIDGTRRKIIPTIRKNVVVGLGNHLAAKYCLERSSSPLARDIVLIALEHPLSSRNPVGTREIARVRLHIRFRRIKRGRRVIRLVTRTANAPDRS